jgi:dolichyldiphosphatase
MGERTSSARRRGGSWLLKTRPPSGAAAASAADGAPTYRPVLESLNNSTKWAVSGLVALTVLARRDLHCAWCLLGSVLAAALCRRLKHALNEARPPQARKADPGMPSSHANSLAFLAAYVALAGAGLATGVAVPAVAVALSWLRVYLGYHTAAQVAAGWALGGGTAAAWWALGGVMVPALAARPQLAVWLYAAAAAAGATFAATNVLRWAE